MAATLTFYLRKERENESGEAPVYLRIIKNRKTTNIATGIKVQLRYWDEKKNRVKSGHPNSARMNALLNKKETEYRDKMLIAETNNLSISIRDIKEQITGSNSTDFFVVANMIVERYKNSNSISSYQKAVSIIKKFKSYVGRDSIQLLEITTTYIKAYERYLQIELVNKINTVHKDLRFIRQVFNEAVKNSFISVGQNPFSRITLTSEKTTRTFLLIDEVETLYRCPLDAPKMCLHRDMFVFACYAGGLRVSDVLLLRWENIKDGRLYLTIKKTASQTAFKIPSQAITIIEKYRRHDVLPSDFIFPALSASLNIDDAIAVDKAISSTTALINKNLKLISKRVGINKPISFHISRHSFAVNALKNGIRMEHVSKLMGHSAIKETQIYAKIINEDLDKAMEAFEKK